jgi:hypothetical protein
VEHSGSEGFFIPLLVLISFFISLNRPKSSNECSLKIGRYPSLVMLMNALLVIMLACEGLGYFISAYPCVIRQFAWIWLLPLVLFITVTRAWMLVANFENMKYIHDVAKRTRTMIAGNGQHTTTSTAAALNRLTPKLGPMDHHDNNSVTDGGGSRSVGHVVIVATANGHIPSVPHGGSETTLLSTTPLRLGLLPWVVRHRWLLRPTYAFRLTLAANFVLLIIWLILAALLSPKAFVHSCEDDDVWNEGFGLVATILPYLYVVLALFLTVKGALRLGRFDADGFKIKQEFKALIMVAFVLLFAQAYAEAVKPWYS